MLLDAFGTHATSSVFLLHYSSQGDWMVHDSQNTNNKQKYDGKIFIILRKKG